jgi:type I restriction enzyme S subunit
MYKNDPENAGGEEVRGMGSSEWREVRVGDVATIRGGKRLPKGVNLLKDKNSHPYIRVRDLNNKKNL